MGINTFLASIHLQNRHMRRLLVRTDYPFDEQLDVDTVEVAIHLQPEAGRGRKRIFTRGRLADPFAGLDLGLNR